MHLIAIITGALFAAAVWRHSRRYRAIGSAVCGVIGAGYMTTGFATMACSAIVLIAAAAAVAAPPSETGRRALILCVPLGLFIVVGGWVLTPVLALLILHAWRRGIRARRPHSQDQPNRQLVARRAEMSLAQLSAAQEFGAPGSVSESTGVFGDAALVGAKGERLAADYLSSMLPQKNGAYLFHGCDWPIEGYDADIDHVWLSAGHILLIDAKLWAAGTYVTNHDGTVARDGQLFDPASRHSMSIAAEMISNFTGMPTSAITALVQPADITRLHPNDGVPFVNLSTLGQHLPPGAPPVAVLQRMSTLLRVQYPTRPTPPPQRQTPPPLPGAATPWPAPAPQLSPAAADNALSGTSWHPRRAAR